MIGICQAQSKFKNCKTAMGADKITVITNAQTTYKISFLLQISDKGLVSFVSVFNKKFII